MPGLVHTPYGDGVSPFAIGLKPLDPVNWLEVDHDLGAYLDEKDRLDREAVYPVFMAQDDTIDAQCEVLDLVLAHLRTHHRDTHHIAGNSVNVGGRKVRLDTNTAPLRSAAGLIAEDLVIMRRNGDGSGWRIAAASLHFPSSWSLAEKFGKALADVHAPVPGFERGTRTAMIVDRIFDNLHVDQPVWRTNFSLYDNAALHHPTPKSEGLDTGYGHVAPSMFIRSEYQTLRKLPVSGDIVFTIRIHIDPMAALGAHVERERLCAGLIDALNGLDSAQLAYKGLDARSRALLIESLRMIQQGTRA